MDEYTCPKCGAILNNQKGFDPEYGAWRCLRCGQMIMDEDTYPFLAPLQILKEKF